MLKFESGMGRIEKLPYMIGTEYSGPRKLGAPNYLEIVEKTLALYEIGDKVCALTNENTQSCVNTREQFARRNRRSLSVNDQSHVADLIIENCQSCAGWQLSLITFAMSSLWCIVIRT